MKSLIWINYLKLGFLLANHQCDRISMNWRSVYLVILVIVQVVHELVDGSAGLNSATTL